MYLVWKIERKLKKIFFSSDQCFEVLNSMSIIFIVKNNRTKQQSFFYVHANQNYFMF